MNQYEQSITEKKFLDKGFVIENVADIDSLDTIRDFVISYLEKKINKNCDPDKESWLNQIHKKIDLTNINELRIQLINELNSSLEIKKCIFEIVKPYVELLVGNELAMQKNTNLVIHLPNDEKNIIDLHADTWGGNSAFEIVVWLPLVNSYGTKSMYILDLDAYNSLLKEEDYAEDIDSESLFNVFKDQIEWMNVEYGKLLLFTPSLPHGQRPNMEGETRLSLNYRFKGVFTPYGEKKLGEYFEPVTLKACSKFGFGYKEFQISK